VYVSVRLRVRLDFHHSKEKTIKILERFSMLFLNFFRLSTNIGRASRAQNEKTFTTSKIKCAQNPIIKKSERRKTQQNSEIFPRQISVCKNLSAFSVRFYRCDNSRW
jgi:hypothetical protein